MVGMYNFAFRIFYCSDLQHSGFHCVKFCILSIFITINQKSCLVEQVDLFVFPPICLPQHEQDFSGLDGTVAGASRATIIFSPFREPAEPFKSPDSPKPLTSKLAIYHFHTSCLLFSTLQVGERNLWKHFLDLMC